MEERLALLQAAIDSSREPAGSVFDRPAYVPDYEMIGDN